MEFEYIIIFARYWHMTASDSCSLPLQTTNVEHPRYSEPVPPAATASVSRFSEPGIAEIGRETEGGRWKSRLPEMGDIPEINITLYFGNLSKFLHPNPNSRKIFEYFLTYGLE